ncbi:MAG TPA: hypothetical protein VM223_07795, partial [Planctomycetota bacterium]|nr:hypothetical protein [Planctomycetota bacterium]
QQIAMPAPVDGAVTNSGADNLCQGGELRWSGAYGPGLDFTYTPSTHFFRKILSIDSLSRIGAPAAYITAGGNPVLQLNFVFASDLDLWIDGVKWDASSRRDTASIVEFRDGTGAMHWWWGVPYATDANGEHVDGTLRVKRQGASLYVSVLVPHAWLAGAQYPVRVDPDTYTGSTTDGYIYGWNADYATARLTSAGLSVASAGCSTGQVSGATCGVYRSFWEFDTSAIDDAATVTQVNLYLTATNVNFQGSGWTIGVYDYGWSSPIDAGNREANYDGALGSPFDANWQTTGSLVVNNTYASSNLDPAWVSKTATTTRYCTISSEDIAASSTSNRVDMGTADNATPSYRPYLSVTVEAAAGNPYYYYQMLSKRRSD